MMGGFSAAELKDAGCSVPTLRCAGFSASALRAAACSVQELKLAGYSASDLAPAGFIFGELKKANVSSFELRGSGHSELACHIDEARYKECKFSFYRSTGDPAYV